MTEFKIQLEDSFVQQYGYSKVDAYLKEFVKKLSLKIAAQELLHDIKEIDLENDPQWKLLEMRLGSRRRANIL